MSHPFDARNSSRCTLLVKARDRWILDLPLVILSRARAILCDIMQMRDHPPIVARSISSLAVVLRDMTEEAVIWQLRMFGSPQVIISSLDIILIQLTLGVRQTREVKVDGLNLITVVGPE